MAEPNTYHVGQRVRFSATFTLNSVPTNPTSVTFQYKAPSGGVTGSIPSNPSAGNYQVDLTLSEEGLWYYRWAGTGTVVAAEERAVNVLPSQVI